MFAGFAECAKQPQNTNQALKDAKDEEQRDAIQNLLTILKSKDIDPSSKDLQQMDIMNIQNLIQATDVTGKNNFFV